MMLNRVDLPQPDGPITARNSPGATVERDVVDRGQHAVRRLEALDDVVDHQDRLRGATLTPALSRASRSGRRSTVRPRESGDPGRVAADSQRRPLIPARAGVNGSMRRLAVHALSRRDRPCRGHRRAWPGCSRDDRTSTTATPPPSTAAIASANAAPSSRALRRPGRSRARPARARSPPGRCPDR